MNFLRLRASQIAIMIVCATAILFSSCSLADQDDLTADPVDYVSTLIGTQSSFSFSCGNTYPAVSLPWGMNCWTPQTGENNDGWIYSYDSLQIRGLRQTHQPSPWMKDYGAFSIMPLRDSSKPRENERGSVFSHFSEIAKPYYYSVYLADHDIKAEMTSTEHSAIMRFTFPESGNSGVVIDAFDGGSYVDFLPGLNTVLGYCTNNNGGVEGNFQNWFVITFDKPVASFDIYDGDKLDSPERRHREHAMCVVRFSTDRDEVVHARIASSFISGEQAFQNLKEVEDRSFDDIMEESRTKWNELLSRIIVEGGSVDQYRTFYSCLYRCLQFPRKFYEIAENGDVIHYSPFNGKIEKGYIYTDIGFWDAFRALFPLMNLVYPDISEEFISGYATVAKETALLPEWASPGHRQCMVGQNSASVIADAAVKGVLNDNIDTLYDRLVFATDHFHPVAPSSGRVANEIYNLIGYVPYGVSIDGSVSCTLEYAYDDWCLLQLAKILHRPDKEQKQWASRANNWQKVFDRENRLMRGRYPDGSFKSPFSPFDWGDDFIEGNSLQYTWSVFHDIQGLSDAMGGEISFLEMLDSVFVSPPYYDFSFYGYRIHEIREMQVADMGNYAHCNQPSQHIPYLYNWSSQPWKGQRIIRDIMDKLYKPAPDGYCGDEDNGQTSAWYIFSALGFYPVCPGSTQYAVGSPLFKKAVITRPDGAKINISAPANAPGSPYIQKMSVNGKNWTHNYIDHNDLIKKGSIKFKMGSEPARDRGIKLEDRPYSFSRNN